METTETTLPVTLKPFEIQKAKLQQIAKDCDIIVTDETFEEAKKNRKLLRDERFAIQNILKENKAIINNLKGDQEKKAEDLIAICQPTEDKLDFSIKEIENRKEIEKAKKEKEAQEKIAARIATLFENEMKFNGEAYELGENTITPVQVKMFSDAEFYSFLDAVKIEHLKILHQKRLEAEEKKAQEEALEKQRQEQEAERKRLANLAEKQRLEQEALAKEQSKKLEEERKAFEEEKKKAQEEIDRQNMAIAAEKEATRLREIEEKEQITNNRRVVLSKIGLTYNEAVLLLYEYRGSLIGRDVASLSFDEFELFVKDCNEVLLEKKNKEEEKELARLKRIESLRPDKEKLLEFALSLDEVKYPKLENEASNRIVDDAMKMILGAQEFVKQSIEKL